MRTVSLLFLLTACGTPVDKGVSNLDPVPGIGVHNPSGEMTPAIFGGSPAGPGTVQSTVSLHEVTRSGSVYITPFCSGTLIDGDVVLTAAHCLDTARGGGSFQTISPDELAIRVGEDPAGAYAAGTFLDGLYLASDTLIHGSYNRRALRNDIALVRTSSTVTERSPVAPLPASLGLTAADDGTWATFAGFGITEVDNGGILLETDLQLGPLGCGVGGCPDAGDPATQVSYVQPDNGPCSGDSGGPAFINRGGTDYVAAVTSYGDSQCLIYGVSTRVDAFESWIGDFTGSAPPPPPPVDTGDPGDPGSCGDGVCDVGESCDGRNGTSSCGDCAGKTNGKPDRRYCYVDGVCEGPGC